MRGLRYFIRRLWALWRSEDIHDEIAEEMRFHIELRAEENIRRGMTPEEARREAERQFGRFGRIKERGYEVRGGRWLEATWQDLRYGARMLLKTPGFTAVAALSLALGIGANTAIFSVVNAVLLRPLPYPESDRIVQLMRSYPGIIEEGQTGRRYLFFRDAARSVSSMAAWRYPTGFNLATGDGAEFVRAMSVSRQFFDVFGVHPAIGQAFTAEQDVAGGSDAAILSHALWRRLFGSNPGAVGGTLLLGGRPYMVVGVMPPDFASVPPADLFIPLRPSTTGPGGGLNYRVAARLKPGVTLDQASVDAASVWEAMRREFPQEIMRSEVPSTFASLQEIRTRDVKPALLMMLEAVGVLLLIACANTAGLLLARASGRAREIAVRAALGASRGRVIRQLLTESVLLSIAGAAIGVLLAYWSVPALLALTPPGFRVYQAVSIDGTVLLATLALAILTGLIFGLVPALGISRNQLFDAFKDDGARTTASRRSGWLRKLIVVGEVGLCMLLLVAAGLLIQTFLRLRAVDPGFDPRGVLTAQMSLQGDRYADAQNLNRFFEQGLDRIRRIPGVQSAAIVNGVPIAQGLNLNVDTLDGPERFENALTDWRYASTDYFRTMGIAIVAGRGFEERDGLGAPPVAVVNEQFARRFFKGTTALGRHIRVFDNDGAIEIVGIAKDVREQGLTRNLPALMYVPVSQANPAGLRASHSYFQMSWVVRATNTGPDMVRTVREQIRALDSAQPFSTFRTMDEVKMGELTTQRFQMTLLGAFAGIGLLLAAAGIYGLIAYSVAQRTRELGIRMALGASRSRILRSVVVHGALLAVIGVAIGIGGAALFTRTLRTFLWGVSALDPFTFGVVAAVLVLVASFASLVPALRAIRLNPLTALREG
jgi:putative ABC transport system permease protein